MIIAIDGPTASGKGTIAKALAAQTGQVPPPNTILNAPTKLMKQQGYGADYRYDPDTPQGFSGQNYWPDGVKPASGLYSVPQPRGFGAGCRPGRRVAGAKAGRHHRLACNTAGRNRRRPPPVHAARCG